ncbi:RNI-like protein [Fragilariopsis cylindrus CCMP1102]|uniref:RNI-like protein n=1 Tax=Fragilariopsis cylindrus CCMP1102 TaxID=635003 RepID=A0A1E7EXD0_9STRA|nr:RNI-like protein [Fragilariopsis cylindrus CCMP1102]|eukprot:OEU10506.1 RNI-like protein [Fragilariopsis cylindrus CCMP1102]
MFIKKDLRKIATILDDAVDCNTYEKENNEDENENDNDNTNNTNKKIKRLKREEPLTVLRLGRRKQEFNGTVQVLCTPSHIPKLKFLHTINLYECNISNLHGFGPMFHVASPNLETINLGRNPIEKIPDDFADVYPSLKHLWLDDCSLSGEFPRPLLLLKNLITLRLPNNNITHLNIGGIDTNENNNKKDNDNDDNDHNNNGGGGSSKVIPLENLKTLCLDRNKLGGGDTFKVSDQRIGTGTEEKVIDVDISVDIDSDNDNDNDDDDGKKKEKEKEEPQQQLEQQDSSSSDSVLPSNLAEWLPNLEGLLLRHNQLTKLGVTIWPTTLQVLHISSNQLSNLNEIMGTMVTMENDNDNDTSMEDDDTSALLQPSNLTHLYANGNQLQCIPTNILTKHPKLQRFVISHNPPLKELSNEIWKQIDKNENDNRDENDNNNTNESSASSSSPCKILWKPNPNLSPPGTKNSSSSNNDDGDGDDDGGEKMQD